MFFFHRHAMLTGLFLKFLYDFVFDISNQKLRHNNVVFVFDSIDSKA